MNISQIGIVIIGRNEGERLVRCLKSIPNQITQVVYVDSASSDDSVKVARGLGAEIVELSMETPFSAARARNEGFYCLKNRFPQIEYVQFVDGDCELATEWILTAWNFLESYPEVAAVCGRRRERFPDKSVYNLLCDIEWNTPIGEAKSCGGDVLLRENAFDKVHGFNPALIAGEEPELCVRLRAAGWKIWRLNQEMTLHDAAMMRFGQWWKRSVRGGYAFAEGAKLHGEAPEKHWVRESHRALIWGMIIPIATLVAVLLFGMWSLILLLVYPLQIARIALRSTRSTRENWWYALFLVLGKFPEAAGQLNYVYNRLVGKTAHLIEYK